MVWLIDSSNSLTPDCNCTSLHSSSRLPPNSLLTPQWQNNCGGDCVSIRFQDSAVSRLALLNSRFKSCSQGRPGA
jgi:hypothetical protein